MTSRILTLLIVVGLAQAALAQNATLITTFTNPTPVAGDRFGNSVATVAGDRLLIGAYQKDAGAVDAGAAFLFGTNGTLLATFANPSPAGGDNFGVSVSALGNDRVLVGAYRDDTGATDAGSAYLFRTNGTLLTTITNPSPAVADWFGNSVAGIGVDRVLVGAQRDDTGAIDAGSAYLFRTNGTLLLTITNPVPAFRAGFGVSVAAVGTDRFLIGAPADSRGALASGVAYLFRTNGIALTTFTNPTPAAEDLFGSSVASDGGELILIGAPFDDTAESDGGAAYLFRTNGTLLATFTSPAPVVTGLFGESVATVGNDRVLIGALFDGAGGSFAGAAYLFGTNGTLLVTIDNPTPAMSELFGEALAAVGNNRVLIGAPDAGEAYLFALPLIPPRLAISTSSPGNATISWMPNTPGFVLQETETFSPANWTNSLSGAANPIIAPTTPPAKYFRLRQP